MKIEFPVGFVIKRIADNESWEIKIEAPGLYTAGLITENDIVLDAEGVFARHLLLDFGTERASVETFSEECELAVDGRATNKSMLMDGQRLSVPGHELVFFSSEEMEAQTMAVVEEESDFRVDLSMIVSSPRQETVNPVTFPPADVWSGQNISVAALKRSGQLVEEFDFLAVGGGLGSFVWVDHLRASGVGSDKIRVLGVDPVCYANYQRYCANSQIPDHERLRSNSQSTPDNIWGFPGYASREAIKGLFRARPGRLRRMLQVFGEPTLAESYTPMAGEVFKSLDREMKRIGWDGMFRRTRALSLRKTDDGRFVVAVRDFVGQSRADREGYVVARHVHLATGYPSTRFVEDFREFIAANPEARGLATNAYEEHDYIYEACEATSDERFVVVRGRGIVASRILQRLSEARKVNPNIKIVHSMRSQLPRQSGAKWGLARRPVRGNVEIQPFNWPKSCWSGDLRKEHESGSLEHRATLLRELGGTSTAERSDWQEIIERGGEENWYRPVYGRIAGIEPRQSGGVQGVQIAIDTPEGHSEVLNAHYLIDCTGLIGEVSRSPFLADLLDTYSLPRNQTMARNGIATPAGIFVSDRFEIEALRNGAGTVWASGTITSGGPYLAVDSFLGLQYAAFRAVDALAGMADSGVRKLRVWRNLSQWLRWCMNRKPS